jgi:hypothetical protein
MIASIKRKAYSKVIISRHKALYRLNNKGEGQLQIQISQLKKDKFMILVSLRRSLQGLTSINNLQML